MKKIIIAAVVASVSSAAAWAQGPPPGLPHRGGFGPGLEMGMHPGKVVTGAPYSANVTFSATQTLADGNTIQHTSTGSVARDAQGRTREQVTSDRGPFGQNGPTALTFITDPVAGYAYTLNANTRVAFRRALRAPVAGAGRRGTRHEGGPEADNRVESDLGTQVIAGVNATGRTATHTIPAGAMGNAQPIISTSETWYSPDLQVPVLAKRNDPRFGQSMYSLSNVQRSEPAASLFQVPSDYIVQDAPKFDAPKFAGPGGPPAPPE